MKKNRKTKNKKTYKIFNAILLIISVVFSILVVNLNAVPTKYLISILIFLLLVNLNSTLLLRIPNLKKKIKKFIYVFDIILMLIMSTGGFYLFRTLDVLNANANSDNIASYSVIVLKDSKYEKISDLKGKEIGYYSKSEGVLDANSKLKKKVKITLNEYTSTDSLASDLLEKKVDSLVLEDSVLGILKENDKEFKKNIKVIYTFSVKLKNEISGKDVDVIKKPFAVYISGIDTYGEITKVSRSDVNLVAVVHPKTKQILLISVPRDYYVQLHGTTGTRDKLTHAGMYGIDMSIQTLEDLLETDINYYVKVNFSSVEDIVDTLGGVEVYSDYTFTSYSGYKFVEGYNTMNGKKALDFVRTRKAFKTGDRQRGINQEALLTAVIKKVTSKSIITKYNSLLKAIDGKYQTNMGSKKMMGLIKMQLADMAEWNITSISLTGYDSYDYTYSANQVLYVMEPDVGSINLAIELIDKLIEGETLEGPYTFEPVVPTIKKRSSFEKRTTSTTTTQTIQSKQTMKTANVEEKVEEPKGEEEVEEPKGEEKIEIPTTPETEEPEEEINQE